MTAASTSIGSRTDRTVRVLAPLSLAHSLVYATLLAVWLLPGLHHAEFVFGLTHGVGWIAMSLLCVTAAARRLIPVRTALAVAVLGGIGPFIGTYEFMRLRRDAGATFRSN
ncbi:MAG: hypothetical protein QM679_10740 [Patulibacter sp.]